MYSEGLSKRMLCSIVGLFIYCKSLFCVCSATASDIHYLLEATIVQNHSMILIGNHVKEYLHVELAHENLGILTFLEITVT